MYIYINIFSCKAHYSFKFIILLFALLNAYIYWSNKSIISVRFSSKLISIFYSFLSLNL